MEFTKEQIEAAANTPFFSKGFLVEKVKPGHVSNGRRGNIIDVSVDNSRARVQWTHNPHRTGDPNSGRELNTKTKEWCSFSELKIL